MSKKTLALSHIDNYINGGKNTILLLENKFFYIFKVQIENVLNEEDRKEKLEDRLEIVFPRYNSDDFVLRYEILKKEVGLVFQQVLEDAGLYKCDAKGREAFLRFINGLLK